MRLTNALALTAALALAPSITAQEAVPSAEAALALVQSGEMDAALAAWSKRAAADPNDGQAQFYRAYALHATGDLDAAHDAHLAAAKFPEFTMRALYNHACVHALRNEKDAAFLALSEAVDAGFTNVDMLKTDTDLDNLRKDARYDSLLYGLRGKSKSDVATLKPVHRFDFYVGSWKMLNGDQVERTIDATSAYDGAGLSVVSTNLDGSANARSLFLFDEKKGVWRQVWMATDGLLVVMEGGLEGDAMILRQVSLDGVRANDARAVFKDIREDGFTYEWQTTADGGETWTTAATRTFVRA